jgi:hypothetical protein
VRDAGTGGRVDVCTGAAGRVDAVHDERLIGGEARALTASEGHVRRRQCSCST